VDPVTALGVLIMSLIKRFITKAEQDRCTAAVLSTHEITPLSHSQRCQAAAEWCADELGVVTLPSFRRAVSRDVALLWSELIINTASKII